jgi:preprotein translocase subunit SecE
MRAKRIWTYASDSWQEAKRVVWPSKGDVLHTGVSVFGFMLTMALFLWACDKSVEWLIYDVLLHLTR